MKKKENKKGGAILDLGAEGRDSDGEPDLSWLPDPDRPKKFDEEWKEVEDDSFDEYNVCCWFFPVFNIKLTFNGR